MKKIYLLQIMCVVLFNVNAQRVTKLPIFFADSMILQRNTLANIWGTDSATVQVIVTGNWGVSDTVITNAAGKWKATLPTTNAGGPYSITVKGSTTRTINNILMGEVWLCSGQSNMEMPMKGYINSTPHQLVDSADFFIANSLNNNIRVFKPGWNPVSAVPLTDFTSGSWISARPSTTPDFSAMAYFFARKIQLRLGVPVGIIVIARGGSKIEAWMDSATLATVRPVVVPPVLNWQDAHITDAQLYKTFLHPLIGYPVKGFLWSQGESNIGTSTYQTLFTKMIASWRSEWGLGELPFYYTQIAPTGTTNDFSAARLREAQLHTMLLTTNTGMVSTLDIGDQNFTHYPKKKVAGDRLADWALIKNYGFAGIPSGPIFKSLTIRGDTINLRFDYTANGLTSLSLGLADFEIAGANKVFYPATVTPANFNFSLNVRSSNVPAPLYVRYAFKNWVQGSLFNSTALPASSFRTEQMQELYTILPTVFGSINVHQKQNTNVVLFTSLQEVNVAKYEIEKSGDGVNFVTIAHLNAKGSNTHYAYDDNYPNLYKQSFYRIKVIDTDGSVNYSKVIKTISNQQSSIKVINPSKNNIGIFFQNSFSGTIILTNSVGKVISTQNVQNAVGAYTFKTNAFIKGAYFLKFMGNDKLTITQLVTIL